MKQPTIWRQFSKQSSAFTWRQQQAVIYFGLLAALLLIPAIWTGDLSVLALSGGLFVCVLYTGWLSYRLYSVQAKMRRLEAQMRALQSKRSQPYGPQSLAHLDVDDLFLDSQTKH